MTTETDLFKARHDLAELRAELVDKESLLRIECAKTAASTQTSLTNESVFGAFDGMTSVAGTIIALLSKSSSAIVLAAIGLAVASACGMGAGEWLSDSGVAGKVRRALVMGGATAVGTLVPAIPFFFLSKWHALPVAIVLALGLSTLIGKVRHKGIKGYVQTFVTIAAAGLVTALVTLLIPAGIGG